MIDRQQKPFLNRKEAARYLESIGIPISHHGLARMALFDNEGRGPPFVRTRRTSRVRYGFVDLQIWAEKNAQRID